MANRPTPAFLRPSRARAAAGKTFTRFKAEAARPEQQAIFRMMIKEDPPGGRGLLTALRSVPMQLALGLVVVSVSLALGRHYGFPTIGEDAAPAGEVASVKVAPGVELAPDAALVPGSRFAVSAAARGVEPPTPKSSAALTPAVTSTSWSLGSAEAREARTPPIPRTRPEPEAAAPAIPSNPVDETDRPGAGGPFASWVPEPKPEPLRLVPAVYDKAHHVNLAVVRYPTSADTIREAFIREVPWERPLRFSLGPFRGGSLQVLSVTGLPSREEALRLCTTARRHGFECLLPEG